MAFKSIKNHHNEQSPYKYDDHSRFLDRNLDPRKIHRVEVTLDFGNTRALGFGEKAIAGTVIHNGKTERIDVTFSGQRLDDLNDGILQHQADAIHAANCATEQYHNSILVPVVVEGAWVPRKWRDAKGVQHTQFDLIAARWSTIDAETVYEGALPAH